MHPNSDHYIEDWDEELTAEMQEREQALSRCNEKLNQEMPQMGLQGQETTAGQGIAVETNSNNDKTQEHTDEKVLTTKSETMSRLEAEALVHQEKPAPLSSEADDDYIWIVWKTFSIISLIHFFWKCRQRNAHLKWNATKALSYLGECMPLVDSRTLQLFHSRYVQSNSWKKHREEEFLEGFVGDLLQSMKQVCSENGGMAIGAAGLEDLHHVIVPLHPPEPYFYKCLYSNQADDVLLDMQMCGHIELVKNSQIQNGCPCQASDADDEMVCLLHKDLDEIKACPAFEKLLCNSNYLSKAEVTKWFQSTLRQAWSLIAVKYEFEVCIGSDRMPGVVIVRFRNGEKINFTMDPVIAPDSHSYLFITPCSLKNLDTLWSLSLSKYEDLFLKQISKVLPINSCHLQTLEITLFLHKRQTMLTGSSALKDLHFKITLMHLLLTTSLEEWRPAFLANRLQDILKFMMYSLKTKQLNHALVGNPQAKRFIQLPVHLVKSNPVNLFHPLVVHKCIYKNALMHFQELLRNAQMLINDYLGINGPERHLFNRSKSDIFYF